MTEKLKVLDLFSGIGGFSLGLERTGGFETVAFCEIDKFCQKVLKKHWPDVPIHDDVGTLEYDGPVDLICGGYPCQPFSTAGKRQGTEDDRHLWPAMFSLIQKHRPAWVIGENVAGHVSMGLDDVLSDLGGETYECRAFIIPACAVDAPHRRDRLWVLAHCDSLTSTVGGDDKPNAGEGGRGRNNKGRGRGDDFRKSGACPDETLADAHSDKRCPDSREPLTRPNGGHNSVGGSENVADADSYHRLGRRGSLQMGGLRRPRENEKNDPTRRIEWPVEPPVGRVAHGIPRRVDRLRTLGNAVVPQIPEIIGRAILESEIL